MVLPIGPQTPGTRGPGGVGERTLSGGVFAPIIAILPRQLQANLIQQLAGQTTAARLVSLSPGGTAQIDIRGTPLEVRLKNVPTGQAPGDTVLINFRTEDMADDPGALTIRDSGVDRSAASRTMEAGRTESLAVARSAEPSTPSSFAQQLSDTGKLLGALSRIETNSNTPFQIDVLLASDDANAALPSNMAGLLNRSSSTDALSQGDATPQIVKTDQAITQFVDRLMHDMMKSIENSGLFYEAHLQQWSEGERTEEDLRSEPQSTWSAEDSLADGALPDSTAPRESARMVANQLNQLDRPMIHLNLPGFFNDRTELIIEPEPRKPRDSKAPPAWFATLRMDLAHLGNLEMRITLMNNQCNVVIKTDEDHRGVIADGFPELMQSMSAAGLALTAQTSTRGAADE